MDSEQYYSTEVEWHSDDLLVLYSDGITEAFNPDAEMYGLERFKALISEKRHLSPMEIKAEILSDLQAYQQDESTNDDITLVVAKFFRRSNQLRVTSYQKRGCFCWGYLLGYFCGFPHD